MKATAIFAVEEFRDKQEMKFSRLFNLWNAFEYLFTFFEENSSDLVVSTELLIENGLADESDYGFIEFKED